MAHRTKMVLLLILATVATALATDFEMIVKAEEHRANTKCSTCCPFGWVKYEGRCFIYQATSLDWVSAEKRCENLGAHLVSIHNENEYQLVKALIRVHDHHENPTWIGLSGCEKRGNFFWSDGTKLTFTRWNPYEPNSHFGECCVHVNWSGQKNWNDIPCSRSYPSVCAKRNNNVLWKDFLFDKN